MELQMVKNSFSILQRIRNKIKIKGNNHTIILEDGVKTNITGCNIYIKGEKCILHIKKKGCRIKNSHIEIIGNNCKLEIGNKCIIGYDCYLSCKETDTKLIINDNCALSRNIKIMTSDGHPIFQNDKLTNQAKNIIINKKVWLADNVTILKGVEIGSNSIIGINSTVTKSISNNSIAIGNPARVKKENITWEL
jgi:acetyltransferase-like isoleucine patch superfamily enzyme